MDLIINYKRLTAMKKSIPKIKTTRATRPIAGNCLRGCKVDERTNPDSKRVCLWRMLSVFKR